MSKRRQPPKQLSREAKKWWREIQQEYLIEDPGGLLLLQTAAECYDRMKRAQAEIERDGEVVKNRFDEARAHPAVSIEKDARNGLLAALRMMELDVEPIRNTIGRPPGR